MKKTITLLALCLLFCTGKTFAQFSPIALTGYNFDAVAEATTALATTSGPLDGSSYVLYSAAYAAIYSSSYGLPNNGTISNGTYTYQLAPYTANNVCFTTGTVTIDSLTLVTPAPYTGLSFLCFSTEGNGSMDVTIRFTDNTTQTFTSQSLSDWYQNNGTTVLQDFDRVNRNGTTPSNGTGSRMFGLDLPILCANRGKNVKNIKFTNLSTPRNVILAISGGVTASYSVSGSPVTCAGGTNGSASVTVSGGVGPFSYSWTSVPAQSGANASNLGVGVYSVIAADGGGSLCAIVSTISITLSLSPQPALGATANQYTICAGKTISLTTSGASTYTWSNGSNAVTQTIMPSSSTIYTVGGYTSFNCYRTGSLSITVNPLPVITFTAPSSLCLNSPSFLLGATPNTGNYSGAGINTGSFFPGTSGVGTKTVSYIVIDNYGCTATVVNTIVIHALPVVGFTFTPNSLCANSDTVILTATPANGTFTGLGVTGTVYTPSVAGVGTQTVSYQYTDANNCTVQKISSVIINPIPAPIFATTKKLFCQNTPTLFLNAQPSGGVFSGVGTTSLGVFSPSLSGIGVHTLTYTSTDFNGCVGKALFTVTVSSCSGINELNTNLASLQVYPNPNTGSFTIKANKGMDLKVVNDLGQLVGALKLEESNGYAVSISELASGIYFVIGQNDDQRIQQKIIVTGMK